MPNHNLYTVMSRRFLADGTRTAMLTASGDTISFADLDSGSARIAHLLCERGLQAGDRVTVQIDKSAEGVLLYLACLRAGLVYHPLNTAYQRSELAFFLENAEPSAIVCSEAYAGPLRELAGATVRRFLFPDTDVTHGHRCPAVAMNLKRRF